MDDIQERPAPKLDPSWAEPLKALFASPVMADLRAFLHRLQPEPQAGVPLAATLP